MVVTNEVLAALRTTVRGEFKTAFDNASASSFYKLLATIIQSGSSSNTYGWLSSFPQMQEWTDERSIKNLKEASYAIANKLYEATLGVKRTDIEDDNLGLYRTLSQSMGQEAIDFLARNVSALFSGGFTKTCYDGQNFFDTEHPLYEKTDGTGARTSQSNICGTGTETGASWYLLSLNRPLKPFILQERSKMELESITDTKQESVFMKDLYMYGIRWRGNFGYGLWQQAVGSKAGLTAANFEAAYAQMQGFKKDGGDKMGIVPTHLVVPATLQSAAESIVTVQTLANGGGNANYKKVELIVDPWL